MLTSPIEEIKSRLDIVQVLGAYIKLKKAGANYRALCPFHGEKTPSFFVSPARQIWHCFGCNLGGDIFRFVMQIEGIEFGDALRMLAQKANVELKPLDKEAAGWKTERKRLYDICETACRFFEKQLEGSAKGKEARKYLLSRNITEQSIGDWRLGWSPETWSGLTDYLTSKKYEKRELEKVGLSVRSEKGSHYDRFRGRIIFPIFDFNGQVIAFGGRVLEKKEGVAKYVNSPATILYDKSRVLYGLNKAKVEMRKNDSCILVEGYTDTILAHQVGCGNTVSSSGTALTSFQLSTLKRYTENLFLAYDMDLAGSSATRRGIDLAQAQGFNIKIVTMPEDKDPADIISENPKAFGKLVEKSVSIMDFYFQTALSSHDKSTPEGKKAISRLLLPSIKIIPNKIEQSVWVQKLSKEIEVKEENIEEELEKIKPEVPETPEFSPSHPAAPEPPSKTRKELLEERILSLILKFPDKMEIIDKNLIPSLSPKAQAVLANFQRPQGLPEDVKDFYNYIVLKSEVEEIENKDLCPEINFCLKEIQLIDLKKELGGISRQIKKAEEAKDSKLADKLAGQFNQKTKDLI